MGKPASTSEPCRTKARALVITCRETEDPYWKMIADLEPELFTQAIRLAQNNQAQAARWLRITRLKMHEKLKEFGQHPRQKPRIG